MSWERSCDLIFDVDAQVGSALLEITGTAVSRGSSPTLVQGDYLPIRVFFKRQNKTTQVYEAVGIPDGYSLVFAGKTSDLRSKVLFSAAGFVASGEGDDLCYVAELNLNTDDLAAEFARGNNTEISVRCDLEVQNPGNTRRTTLQVDSRVRKQIYAGEGPVASADPPYPAPDQLVVRAPDGGNFRVINGTTWQLLNPESGLFHTLIVVVRDGVAAIVPDQTGVP